MNQEQLRLKASREQGVAWKKWGPYLDPDRALSLGKEAAFLKGTAGKKYNGLREFLHTRAAWAPGKQGDLRIEGES
jgi:hypothetical protein